MKIGLLIFLLLVSGYACAKYTCTGGVQGVSINPRNGTILVEKLAGLEWPVLCSVQAEANGITAEACRSIYSILLTAQMSQKEVSLWFDDDATGGSCDSHGSWTYLKGWYFGPRLNN